MVIVFLILIGKVGNQMAMPVNYMDYYRNITMVFLFYKFKAPLCSKAPNDEKTEQTYTIVTSRSEIKEFVAEPLPFNAVTKVTIEVTTSTILVYFNDALKLNFQYKNVNCYALLKDYVANLNAYADNSIIKSLIIEPATTCQNRDECNVNMAQRFNFNNNMYVNDGDIPPHLSNVRCTNKYGCRSTDDKLKCCAAKCNSLFAGLHSNCPTGTTAKLKASEIPCKGTNCGLYTDSDICCATNDKCSARIYSYDGSLCVRCK